MSLIVGETYNLKATKTGDKISSWTSSNKSVATVTSEGKVKAIAPGTANITLNFLMVKKLLVRLQLKKWFTIKNAQLHKSQ